MPLTSLCQRKDVVEPLPIEVLDVQRASRWRTATDRQRIVAGAEIDRRVVSAGRRSVVDRQRIVGRGAVDVLDVEDIDERVDARRQVQRVVALREIDRQSADVVQQRQRVVRTRLPVKSLPLMFSTLVTVSEFTPLARLIVSLPPPRSTTRPAGSVDEADEVVAAAAGQVLDVDQVQRMKPPGLARMTVSLPCPEIDLVTEDVASDRQEVVAAGSRQRGVADVRRLMAEISIGLAGTSRRQQHCCVAELQHLDVGEDVGAVARGQGVRDLGLPCPGVVMV